MVIELILMLLRYAFLILLYLFILVLFKMMVQDLYGSKEVLGHKKTRLGLVVKKRGDQSTMELGQFIPLTESLSIGRYADNDLALGDPHVSANHARIYWLRGSWYLEDLGSTNGTFLNGKRIRGKKRLQRGDLLQIGDITFQVVRWENAHSGTDRSGLN